MAEVKRLLWVSDNGKYKLLIRHFEGDPSPIIGCWKMSQNGKFGPVRYRMLPEYVKEQIEVMKSQLGF